MSFTSPIVSGSHLSLTARSAVLASKEYVKFVGVRTYFLNQGVPLPSYYVYFGTSQDLAENSLSGANFDATWNFAGNANSISALHFRYDYYNNAYVSFEQHIAGNGPHEFAVFSVNPATKEDKYWNLITGEHIGSKFEIDTFTQLYTFQKWLEMPSASAQTTYVTLTQAFHRSYLHRLFQHDELQHDRTRGSVLSEPSELRDVDVDLVQQSDQQVAAVSCRPASAWATTTMPTAFRTTAAYCTRRSGISSSTSPTSLPNVKIGDRNQPYKLFYLNASMDWSRQWYSVPHHINTQNTTISLSRQWSRFVSSYASYSIQNTSDLYCRADTQSSAPLLPDGTPYTPFESFRGAATLRTDHA